LVAQSVEQRPFKPLVLGSSPSQPTTLKFNYDSVNTSYYAASSQRFSKVVYWNRMEWN
jgi:hypothetical protein